MAKLSIGFACCANRCCDHPLGDAVAIGPSAGFGAGANEPKALERQHCPGAAVECFWVLKQHLFWRYVSYNLHDMKSHKSLYSY